MTAPARTRLRLALRDLASAAAFASIAVSGSVPLWAIAAFGVALVLSMLGTRLLARHAGLAALGVAAAAVVLFASALGGGVDLVVAACTFAALVTGHRLLSAPATATDNQVHLTALLMLTGGAALSGELAFGLCLAAFTVLGSLSLALGVLEGGGGEDAPLPVRPLLRRVGAGAALAVAGGVIFFIAFPRLSWNLAARRASPGLGPATTGFSDRVRLGGGGNLKSNPRVVLRATITPDPRTAQLEGYWQGRTFEDFNGREWLGRGRARPPRQLVTLGRSSRELVHQKIELLPAYDSRTLVALEPAVMVGNALGLSRSGSARIGLVEVPGEEVHFAEPAISFSYHAYSLPPGAAPATEAAVEEGRYLALPPTLDPRVRELARQVVGAERDPLAAARALQGHLKTQYRYTLEMPGELDDPLASFLFERKEGHCEHFATALAVLLRSAGFPARVAAGFFGGERIADQYIVRAGDAHAWAQVYVPGTGFVSVDATPDAGRAGQPPAALALLTRVYEQLDGLWRAWVIDYTFQDQAQLARSLVRPPKAAAARASLPEGRAWLAAAGVALLVYGAWRSRALRPRPRALASFAEAIERELKAARVPRRPDEPLEELSLRLRRTRHPLAPALAPAVRRYLEARFGERPLAAREGAALLSALRRAGERRPAA